MRWFSEVRSITQCNETIPSGESGKIFHEKGKLSPPQRIILDNSRTTRKEK